MDFMAGGGASGVGPPDATKIIIMTLMGRALNKEMKTIKRITSKRYKVCARYLDSAAAKEDP